MALPPLKGGFFFRRTELAQVKEPALLIPKCGACGLLKQCRTPKMPVSGKGRKGVLIVGDAPDREEDQQGKPFVGESGVLLRRSLRRIGVDPDNDCWFTNSIICHPCDGKMPDKAIEYCRPNLTRTIAELSPNVIVLVGANAVRALLATAFKEDVGGIKRWVGWVIPCRKPNAWVVPTFHPSFVMQEERIQAVLQRMLDEHLAAASTKTEKPWEKVPDLSSEVLKLHVPDNATRMIRRFNLSPVIAFDYETNMLKPDSPDARIVCCSISDGKTTIAYPWMSSAIHATKELLANPKVGKIASNMKFEERWTRRHLGIKVANWKWDTMIQAHVLDNRQGVTSIKFQAFVRLGQEDYDSHLKPYLQSKNKGGNMENRVREIDLPNLLTYCGLDSLLEYKVAMLQAKELGVRL
jgi:uracil-DNA glycosylase family 4